MCCRRSWVKVTYEFVKLEATAPAAEVLRFAAGLSSGGRMLSLDRRGVSVGVALVDGASGGATTLMSSATMRLTCTR